MIYLYFLFSKLQSSNLLYLISILLVFFLLSFYFYFFSFLLKEIFNKVSNTYLEKNLYLIINESVSELIKKENISNFFILNINDDNEILYVDYDLKHSYIILEKVTDILKYKLNEKSIVYFLPIGMSSNNVFLLNYGPKIGFKVDYLIRSRFCKNFKTTHTHVHRLTAVY